jgi:HAD superfamily hydrolase (TIGR01490 family)
MKLALFDLDHTLLPLDSDHSWGEFTIELGWTDAQTFRARNDAFYAHYQAGTLDIHDYVRFATEAACVRGPVEAAKAHNRYMDEVIRPRILPQALELVRGHQREGETVVIVTATNEFVTRPIAQAFGVSELIAVELERNAHGWITGEIKGTPSFREGKVARVEQWLSARGLAWGDVEMSFYSDSMNDLPLLEKVQRPVATNPDARLRQWATQRGWPVLDLFTEE